LGLGDLKKIALREIAKIEMRDVFTLPKAPPPKLIYPKIVP
jgi:hypothetical protein